MVVGELSNLHVGSCRMQLSKPEKRVLKMTPGDICFGVGGGLSSLKYGIAVGEDPVCGRLPLPSV